MYRSGIILSGVRAMNKISALSSAVVATILILLIAFSQTACWGQAQGVINKELV